MLFFFFFQKFYITAIFISSSTIHIHKIINTNRIFCFFYFLKRFCWSYDEHVHVFVFITIYTRIPLLHRCLFPFTSYYFSTKHVSKLPAAALWCVFFLETSIVCFSCKKRTKTTVFLPMWLQERIHIYTSAIKTLALANIIGNKATKQTATSRK